MHVYKMYIILWKCCCTIVGRKHLLSYWSRSQRPHKCTRGPKQRQNCARVWCISSPLPSLRQTPTTSCTLFYNTCDATLTTEYSEMLFMVRLIMHSQLYANIKKWLAIIQYIRISHLVSVSSSGYLSTTFMISRHTKPMLSIFLSPYSSCRKKSWTMDLKRKVISLHCSAQERENVYLSVNGRA